MKKVALVQYVTAHYREAIYRLLCKQDEGFKVVLYSDKINTEVSIKTIDSQKALLPVDEGGLRWRFIKSICLFGNFIWQKGVVKLGVSKEFDVIIYSGSVYFLSTWISCFLARLTGKRTLMWSHGFLKDEKGIKSWIRIIFYHLADGMLLYHNRAKYIMIKKGFDPRNLYVVYNSLDYDVQIKIRDLIGNKDRLSCRQKLFKNPALPILLFIGRLTPQKNLGMMIEAARILKDRGRQCNILFVGDGPESEELLKLAKQLKLDDNLCLYGACYEEDQIALLVSTSNICVAPGAIGLTCMHSLVYGTPVITHDDPDSQMPEYEAITSGYNGLFFKKDSVEDMAVVIEQWLRKNKDPRTIANQCHEIIDQYYNPHYQIKVVEEAILQRLPSQVS